jgi:hypothetical protein
MEPPTTAISNEVATNRQVCEALVAVDELTPFDHSKDKTPFEGLMDRWSLRLLLSAVAGLIGLLTLVGVKQTVGLSSSWTPWALGLMAIVAGLPQVALLCKIVPGFWMLYRFRESAARLRYAALQHDMEAAQKLYRFPSIVLQILDSWLEQHNARQQARLAMLFGGSDKMALFSITVFGLALGRQFVGAFEDAQKMIPGLSVATWHRVSFGCWLVLAGVTGLSIGGVAIGRVVRRTAYQRDLLKLALDAHERRTRGRQSKVDAPSGRQAR